jgi:PAS domain S-box-containing protein
LRGAISGARGYLPRQGGPERCSGDRAEANAISELMPMKDAEKTKEQLIEDLEEMRRRVAILQAAESLYRQTKEALRKSAEEIQDIYDNAPCGYHSLNKDGIFVKINNTELSWLGYVRDEIIGKKFPDLITPEYLHVFEDNFPRLKERGWVRDLEFEMIRKDGSIMPVLLNATALKDEAGNFLMSRSTLFNITDRKRIGEALIESERKYRLLAEKMTDIAWMMDMNLRTVYVSPSIETVLGFSPEERMAQDVHEQLTPASMSVAQEILAREFALEQQGQAYPGRNVTLELEYYHKDGSTRWLENIISGIRNDQGILTAFHGVSRDITDRKAAEDKMAALNKELEEANRQLGLAYTQMKENRDHLRKHLFEEEMAFLVDGEGFIKGVTERVLEYAGKTREELTGINITDLFHESCRKVFMEELRQAWLGVSNRISVEMAVMREDEKIFETKMTRTILDDKKLLLVILR